MRNINVYRTRQICLLIAFFTVIIIRLFYKLDVGTINVTDEAWYGINAFEMFKSGNWLVPTLRGQIDYASKPPLGLWGILIGFKIFGTNLMGLRFYSAVAGLLTIIIICIYLYKRFDNRYALAAAAVFPALWQCFDSHMYRAGDMDALFGLFYAIAIFALSEIARGDSRMIVVYWAAVGLGFMTKSMHVVVFLLVGFLYLPVIYKKLNVKDSVFGILAGLLPTVVWVAARYQVDGFKYIRSITLGEAGDQTRSGITLDYLRDISREKVTWLLIALLLVRLVMYFVHGVTDDSYKGAGLPEKRNLRNWFRIFGRDIFFFIKRRYLSILAYCVPIGVYTLAGHYMTWYIDPAYIAVIWIVSIEAIEISDMLGKTMKKRVFVLIVALACLFYSSVQIYQYKDLGEGGNPVDQFGHDMTEFCDNTSGEYAGCDAYIAYDRGRYVGDRGHWELDYVFTCNTKGNLNCLDGGVEGFLADEDSLLVLDSELWDQYASVLTGYVFLEQNTFYVLSHDRYGE